MRASNGNWDDEVYWRVDPIGYFPFLKIELRQTNHYGSLEAAYLFYNISTEIPLLHLVTNDAAYLGEAEGFSL